MEYKRLAPMVLSAMIIIVIIVVYISFNSKTNDIDCSRDFFIGYWDADVVWKTDAGVDEFSILVEKDELTRIVSNGSNTVTTRYVIEGIDHKNSSCGVSEMKLTLESDIGDDWDGKMLCSVCINDGTMQLYKMVDQKRILLARLYKDNQMSNVVKYAQ